VLHVTGLTPGQTWRVHTLTGTQVYSAVATAARAEIPLPARGICLVVNGQETVKVIINYFHGLRSAGDEADAACGQGYFGAVGDGNAAVDLRAGQGMDAPRLSRHQPCDMQYPILRISP
jgi:hypothetical protein